MSTTDMSVANTILEQLGGRRFLVMTGARNLLGDERSLHMKVGSNEKRVTHVRITLNGLDLYDVAFLRVRGTKVATVAEAGSIYADQLRAAFERETGLATSL